MAIAFACEGCGKAYEVPDTLAGKRGRCKACGHEFRIPAAGMTPSDVYGMDDDDAPLSRSSSPASAGGSASAGSPRMKRFAPVSDDAVGTSPIARSKPNPVDAENQAQFRNIGIWLMIAGVGAFVLPLIGLQIKGLHRLPPQAQQGGGVLFLMLGAMVFGVSFTRRPMRSVGFGCAGIAGLAVVGLLLIFATAGLRRGAEPELPPPIVVNREREGVPAPRIPRPPFGEGVPQFPPNVPAANPAASGYPPAAVQPFGPGSSPAPMPPRSAPAAPVRPAAPKAPNAPSLPPPGDVEPGMLVALGGARGLQTPAPEFAPRIVAVTAEFRLAGEWPRENVQLVVEANGWNTSHTVFRPREVSGSVEVRVVIAPGVKGPFHCYLGKRDNARGPNAYVPISNTVDLTIEDDPRFGGMPRGPRFGPSGPPPGFPGGRPGRPGPPE
ncbi:MAG: hypothetical protein SFX72_15620 [Isosphaeraceae bacterium]|nr:hypothetical protein [Isosphaeraceae bacterium]